MTPIPTQLGDVLILETARSIKVHAVGIVTRDGQQDFGTRPVVKYVNNHDMAVAEAKTIVNVGRRIYVRNLDTGGWSEVTQ